MTFRTVPMNLLPNGLTLLQVNPDCAARLDPEARDHFERLAALRRCEDGCNGCDDCTDYDADDDAREPPQFSCRRLSSAAE